MLFRVKMQVKIEIRKIIFCTYCKILVFFKCLKILRRKYVTLITATI